MRSCFGARSLLSQLPLCFRGMVEVLFSLCCAFMDHPAPLISLEGRLLPGFEVKTTLFQVCFDVVFIPLFLPPLSALSFFQLTIQDLLWKAVVRHADDMTGPS